ncbi:MAG: radical SAM protein [Candidatus Calescibacterium sp.]|nr:radical SAM protein [Candidatus Calescibacterium sp.]MDW8133002.1 radical SAM protein [Candidatus Calescibacterium sp.]
MLKIIQKIFGSKNKNRKVIQIAVVDIASICNAKCPFCSRNHMPQKGKLIDIEDFKKIVYKLKNSEYTDIKEFRLYATGEPTLHPKLDEIIKISKENFPYVTLSTNCTNIAKYKESLSIVDHL